MSKAPMPPSSSPAITTRSQEFWTGVRQELPLQLGVAPFGLVFGVLGLASGLTPLQTILLSSIIFGGASQVVFAQLWGAGVPAPVVGASVSVVNLRHTLYSASIAPYLRRLPLIWRIPLAYLLTDEAYAVTINRLRTEPASAYQHYHLLGTGMTLWICWQISTITGVIFGATIPQSWSLGFAIPLTFIAIVAPAIRRRADLAACLTAGIISVVGQPLPWKSWIILAAIGGIAAGYLTHRYGAGEAST
ncbi:MAG: AzlC family ABC transporter permease [Candidatus Puniceispirillaceae bacterium]